MCFDINIAHLPTYDFEYEKKLPNYVMSMICFYILFETIFSDLNPERKDVLIEEK